LKFHKRSQLFIRTHNETLSVAVCVRQSILFGPRESTVET